jgi:ornithine cyclodeaminase/alanine dehydrogenase-like protein (mu-crystallin family)
MLPRLAEASAEIGLPFEAVPLERLGAEADVIITITSGFAPILMRDQVKPGTHIAAMGTDTKGKQELDPALVATARVFTDEVAQAVSIGECQHAVAGGLLAADASPRLARWSRARITRFDGTGIALQDLAVAAAAASIAAERKLGLQIDL